MGLLDREALEDFADLRGVVVVIKFQKMAILEKQARLANSDPSQRGKTKIK